MPNCGPYQPCAAGTNRFRAIMFIGVGIRFALGGAAMVLTGSEPVLIAALLVGPVLLGLGVFLFRRGTSP